MHWIWWLVIAIICFVGLLPFAKITVAINYFHEQDNDDLTIKLSTLLGLASYTINVPVLKVDKEHSALIVKEEDHSAMGDRKKTRTITAATIMADVEKVTDFIKHIIGFHKIVKQFLAKIMISQFSWRSELGLEDAAATGTLIGAVWGIKGGTLGILSYYMRFIIDPIIEVTPDFQKVRSHTELTCIFSFRLGYAIIAALQIVKHWKSRPNLTADNFHEKNGI